MTQTAIDLDLAALIIRLAIGPMLVFHGLNKVLGKSGLAGTTRWFDSLGLRPGWLHARVAAVNEISLGLLALAGFLTGLVAIGYVGVMTVAALTDHRGKGYFIFKGGCEYTVLIGMVAVGWAALGSGAWSVDALLSLDLAGSWWALAALVVGVGSARLLLAVSYRPPRPAQ